jgi:tetratricopeptide (TPR) repeat protein
VKIVRRSLIAGFAFAFLSAGCAELITYSKKSESEGDKLMAAGRVEEAAGAYRNATQQNPAAYASFLKLGQAYEQLGREQQALQSYRAAVDVAPATKLKEDLEFREKAVNGLAGCIARSASRDAEMNASSEKAGKSGKAVDWYVIARTYVAAGDADNAIDAYDRAMLASSSQDQPIAKSFGLYLAQIGQNKRAEATLTKAYQLKPDDAEVVAALRKIGVVPGPSLLEAEQMHQPMIPKGPIPELELNVKDKNNPPARAAE